MAKGTSGINDIATLQMALIGFELEKKKIEAKIQEIQAKLKGKKLPLPSAAAEGSVAAPKRILSPAARRRIANAQKKRWAEHRRKKAAAAAQAKQS